MATPNKDNTYRPSIVIEKNNDYNRPPRYYEDKSRNPYGRGRSRSRSRSRERSYYQNSRDIYNKQDQIRQAELNLEEKYKFIIKKEIEIAERQREINNNLMRSQQILQNMSSSLPYMPSLPPLPSMPSMPQPGIFDIQSKPVYSSSSYMPLPTSQKSLHDFLESSIRIEKPPPINKDKVAHELFRRYGECRHGTRCFHFVKEQCRFIHPQQLDRVLHFDNEDRIFYEVDRMVNHAIKERKRYAESRISKPKD